MAEEGTESPTLFTKDDTSGEYVAYEPPEPKAFHETLPEDLRESEHLKEVENTENLARYYVDLKKDYLAPPETAEGYEFEMPEGFDVDSDAYTEFKSLAFEQGINQKQFAALMNLEAGRHKSALESIQTNIDNHRVESEKALKAEYGDKYEQKLESAKKVLNHGSFADGEFKKFLEETRFGDNPQVIRFFSKLGDLISEDAFSKPGTGSGQAGPELSEDGRPMLNFPSMEGK